ncbi:MAG: hypothetical protein LBP85_01875 [Prevotellaceae bacterium]|jgi:hypothetical protein|nr:hypothetical protein [Prevotellaceae bacterium]
MEIIELGFGLQYIPEARQIIAMQPSSGMFEDRDLQPKVIGKLKVAPWGEDNDLPQQIRAKAEASEVVSSNLLFNTQVAYGLGPKPMRRIVENGKVVGYEELIDGEEAEFFEDNDIGLYMLEQLTDMNYFFNAFPEIILSLDKKKIVSLRSKEALFSRWSIMNGKARIEYHLYSAKWDNNPTEKDIEITDALDDYNPLGDLHIRLMTNKYRLLRFMLSVFMPTPGRQYYPLPNWYSIFQSGWYDHAVAIPLLKNTILKNNLGVKYIIYISQDYWNGMYQIYGINEQDKKAVQEFRREQIQKLSNFASGKENAGKAIAVEKRMRQVATGTAEERLIEIIPIKNDLSGGELLQDSEEASNIISYSMGVHTALIGATPGKNKGSLGGTDKRELFMIKQALMKPLLHRVLRPFSLIKRFNGWNKDFVIQVPEYTFTTLDQAKSGKVETVDNSSVKTE